MVCAGLDRGHCSCPNECCIGPQGTCICPDCECRAYDRPRQEPLLVSEPATADGRRWIPWPV